MSRIGRKPIPVGKAKVSVSGQTVSVEGTKGKLTQPIPKGITVKVEGDTVLVSRPDDERQNKALHGLTRALVANMIEGVTNGYKKVLEIQGVGYKAELKGKSLVLNVGYANQITKTVPASVTVTMDGQTKLTITGADKQAVGQFAAEVRQVRKPEPYKGKGIRYEGEAVKIKPGKAFAGSGSK
jgi:large subunit ribosomal protein L6